MGSTVYLAPGPYRVACSCFHVESRIQEFAASRLELVYPSALTEEPMLKRIGALIITYDMLGRFLTIHIVSFGPKPGSNYC